MQKTANLKLNKPELSDPADITELNINFDILDRVVGSAGIKSKTTAFCVNDGSLDSNGTENLLYIDNSGGSQEVAFEQPILTQNGTIDGSSFAVYCTTISDVYKAFDGNDNTYINVINPNIIIYNPVELKLNKLSIKSKIDSNISLTIYGNDTNTVELAKFNDVNLSKDENNVFVLPSNISKYKKFQISITGENYQISEIQLGANLTQTVSKLLKFRSGITATSGDGKSFSFDAVSPKDISTISGTKTVFINEIGSIDLLSGNIFTQKTEPSANNGDIWLKTLEPLSAYIKQNNAWINFYGVPVGSVSSSSANTFKYNQNNYNINAYSYADENTAGVLRIAGNNDEINSSVDNAAITPKSLYNINDFRRKNTSYSLGKMVNCPYHAEYKLKCIQSGTTSASNLDTRNVTANQNISDGGVIWQAVAIMTGENPEHLGEVFYGYYTNDAQLSGYVSERTGIAYGENIYKTVTYEPFAGSRTTKTVPEDKTEIREELTVMGHKDSLSDTVNFSEPLSSGEYVVIEPCYYEEVPTPGAGDTRPFSKIIAGVFLKIS